MIITYFRSSSYNTYSMCPQQYFINYVLGWQAPSGKKAIMGTITHKVLEILAKIKLAQQKVLKITNSSTLEPIADIPYIIKDDICGTIDINNFDIHKFVELVYTYYSKDESYQWIIKDFEFCKNSVLRALDFNNGAFNPLNSFIVSPEQQFDIEFREPWAIYENNGETGFLSLKGTIDLIIQPDINNPKILELIDYKTGKFYNWITDEEKTEASLRNDPQLLLYYLAISYLYPDVEQIIVTIYYINNVGPMTMCYTKEDIQIAKDMIKKRFDEIKSVTIPKLNRTWKCNRLCHYSKGTFAGSEIKPIQEFRNGQVCKKGEWMTTCEQIRFAINKYGMEQVVKDYTKQDHSVGHYHQPGTV